MELAMRVLVKSWSLWMTIVLLRTSASFSQPGWFLQQPPWPTTENLESVATPDSSTIFAVGDRGTIVCSTDGGVTWTQQSAGTTNRFRAVFFVDANTGTIVGDSGIILRTGDGGKTWTSQF